MSLLGNLCSCLRPTDECVCALDSGLSRDNEVDTFALDDTPLVCPVRPDDKTCESCQ